MNEKTDIMVSDMMEKIRGDLILPKKAYFFDTTLRDGEQTPGISFTLKEKISIAQSLNDLGIDVIEAGFPAKIHADTRITDPPLHRWGILPELPAERPGLYPDSRFPQL